MHTKDAGHISINSVFVCIDASLSSEVIRLLSNRSDCTCTISAMQWPDRGEKRELPVYRPESTIVRRALALTLCKRGFLLSISLHVHIVPDALP